MPRSIGEQLNEVLPKELERVRYLENPNDPDSSRWGAVLSATIHIDTGEVWHYRCLIQPEHEPDRRGWHDGEHVFRCEPIEPIEPEPKYVEPEWLRRILPNFPEY